MKKILAIVLLTLSTTSMAHGYRGGYYYDNNQWVAPAVAGIVIGGLAARAYYTPPPVYVQQPQVIYIQQSIPPGYVQQQILDANCNCYRTVLVLQ
jgi:hypothetical protein